MSDSPIVITINGAELPNRRGFLIAPLGASRDHHSFPSKIALHNVSDESVEVCWLLESSGVVVRVLDGAGDLEGRPVIPARSTFEVTIEAASPSTSEGDIRFTVVPAGLEAIVIALTSLANARLWFSGRFETRLATERDVYNSPRGNPGGDATGGWTWALEDEEPFCPEDPDESVPSAADENKSLGRVIRFSRDDGSKGRPHTKDIGVYVTKVQGTIGHELVDFEEGDLVFGARVNLGPNTFFAGNTRLSDADLDDNRIPEEQHHPGQQPIGLFEFSLSRLNLFIKGASLTLRHRAPTQLMDIRSRFPEFHPPYFPFPRIDDRPRPREPFADEAYSNSNKVIRPGSGLARRFRMDEFGTHNLRQATDLSAEANRLRDAGQQDTTEYRNLLVRISFLLLPLAPEERRPILDSNDDFVVAPAGSSSSNAWNAWQEFNGIIATQDLGSRDSPAVIPTTRVDSPLGTSSHENSTVLQYLEVLKEPVRRFTPEPAVADVPGFMFHGYFFNFHSDDLCGQFSGCIYPRVTPVFQDYEPPEWIWDKF